MKPVAIVTFLLGAGFMLGGTAVAAASPALRVEGTALVAVDERGNEIRGAALEGA